ncbi:MAG: branched-chain amino acid ABC transporter permease [Paracoccaceae bacterium]|nr:branched-chain amino acid ABC transporter permease [Paracoccaceae bacterium]MDE2914909.1 branched-chain amino acid ABC transporter permease [Paracoccaceae bacterium]
MILQHIADGILSGAIVSLGAIGLSFTMKLLRFANFSHSELLTWGAYGALVFLAFFASFGGFFDRTIGPFSFGVALLLAMICASVVTSIIALVLHRFVFERLSRTAGHMTMVFASFGVALVLRHLVVLIWGSDPIYYSNALQFAILLPGNVRVMPDQVFLLGLTIIVVIALHLFMTRSRTGIAMRGVAENPDLARVSGVNVDRIITWVWIIGASGAAMGGVLYGMTVQLRPELGFSLILPLFAAAILGGAGSLYGAVLGGLIVGLSENLSVMIIPTTYKPAVPFLLILAILYFRPDGIFGERSR